MRKKRWLGVLGGLIFVCICICLIGSVVLGKIGYAEFFSSPRLVSVWAYQKLDAPYQLSEDQQGYVNTSGYPASFSIMFYQEQGKAGQIQEVRHETWYYLNPDLKITFINVRFSAAEAS